MGDPKPKSADKPKDEKDPKPKSAEPILPELSEKEQKQFDVRKEALEKKGLKRDIEKLEEAALERRKKIARVKARSKTVSAKPDKRLLALSEAVQGGDTGDITAHLSKIDDPVRNEASFLECDLSNHKLPWLRQIQILREGFDALIYAKEEGVYGYFNTETKKRTEYWISADPENPTVVAGTHTLLLLHLNSELLGEASRPIERG